MAWKKKYNDQYEKLKSIFPRVKQELEHDGVTVRLYEPEFYDEPDWTKTAYIEVFRYVGGHGDTVRKVTIWYDKKFEAVENENSDMLDTDYETIKTKNVEELIAFADGFIH